MNELDKISIKYVRVLSTIMILLCHLVVTFDSVILQKTSQFLNVGVFIFLAISGYLFGKRNISNINKFGWLKSRFKRIQMPIYFFLLFLLLIYLVKNIEIEYTRYFIYIVGLQAIELYLNGAEHLWYITIVLICYLITPILNEFKIHINKKKLLNLSFICILIQIILSYFVSKQLGIYSIHICLYVMTYFISYYTNSESIGIRHFFISLFMIIISLIIRIIGLVLFDGTILYDVFIVGYTHSVLALGIFLFVFFVVKKCKKYPFLSIINHFDKLSYEIYIVHYMFIVGPISLLVTNNKILNCLIVLTATYISALILNRMVKVINNIL